MVDILFICTGNICRSPLAHGVFEGVLRREGLESEVLVDSAGTGHWHVGSPPDDRAMEAASLRGVDISSQRARRIAPEDCQNFDYILTMDEYNYHTVAALCQGELWSAPFWTSPPNPPRWRSSTLTPEDPRSSSTFLIWWKKPRRGCSTTYANDTSGRT